MGLREEPLVLKLHNPRSYDALFHLVIDWGSLSWGAELHLAVGDVAEQRWMRPIPKKTLRLAGVRPASRRTIRLFPHFINNGGGPPLSLAGFRIYTAVRTRENKSRLPGLFIAADRPVQIIFKLELPTKKRTGPPQHFDVLQMEGTRVVGGCTVAVRE
jgi:hypothetical protein